MSRQRPSLREPALGEDLAAFPIFQLDTERDLYRVTRDRVGPWWFGSTMEGRFDLAAPMGTCYLASDPAGALLEVLGPFLMPGGAAPASLLEGRHLRKLQLPKKHRLANTLVDKAARWVTAELSTIVPYSVPQAWARVLHAHGLKGIRYGSRHSTSRRRYSYALFGRAGERSWKKGKRIAIDEKVLGNLSARCGITLFERPYSDQLVFASK